MSEGKLRYPVVQKGPDREPQTVAVEKELRYRLSDVLAFEEASLVRSTSVRKSARAAS